MLIKGKFKKTSLVAILLIMYFYIVYCIWYDSCNIYDITCAKY